MATLFSGVSSNRFPESNADDGRIIIVEGNVLNVYPRGKGHAAERYLVVEDFDLLPILLESRSKVKKADDHKGALEVALNIGTNPIITIEIYGDIVSIMLVNEHIQPLAKSH